jgi:thiamine pyrophosphate-dependent acetolactate synthase large subunit-like protein
MGLGAEYVTSAAGLPSALKNARAYGGSYLIEVEFDGSYTIWPEAFLWNNK